MQLLGELLPEWSGVKALIVVERTRQIIGREKVSVERHYYISSLDRRTKAKRLAEYIRGHWSVENNLHWQLDISFREDEISSAGGISSFIAGFLNLLYKLSGSRTRIKVYKEQSKTNLCDAAIAHPLNAEEVALEVLELGKIQGMKEGKLDMKIRKFGRTTALTNGVITQTDLSVVVNYGYNKTALFSDQLMAGAMSQGGDSGSAVLDEENNLVGLLFAGSDTTTIINRIQNVFSALDITLP